MANLTIVDMRENWQEVAPGLREICRPDAGLIPEDYYTLVVLGKASLAMGEQGDGFVILQTGTRQDGPGGQPYKVMRVMAAWSKAGDARRRYLPGIEAIARQDGCRFLEFDTTRQGFLRDRDWTLDKMVFRREVPHGQE